MQPVPLPPAGRILVLCILLAFAATKSNCQSPSLTNAFAHNDYWHKRPLFDALENGFTYIEADIYLRKEKLVISHMPPLFGKKRTLEHLYLDPLLKYVQEQKTEPITLAIDIKSGAAKTYQALQKCLDKYKPILSSYESGVITYRQVTIVLTGHRPTNLLKEKSRIVFLDENLRYMKTENATQHLALLASCKYSRILTWNGTGEIPQAERSELCQYVKQAHQLGQKVRLWASPEKEAVWTELLNCGVDLINTDRLADLKSFLVSYSDRLAKTAVSDTTISKTKIAFVATPAPDNTRRIVVPAGETH